MKKLLATAILLASIGFANAQALDDDDPAWMHEPGGYGKSKTTTQCAIR